MNLPKNSKSTNEIRFEVYKFDNTKYALNPVKITQSFVLGELRRVLDATDVDFCQLTNDEFVFWSLSNGIVFTKKVARDLINDGQNFSFDIRQSHHYNIKDFGINIISYVQCVPNTQYFLIKGGYQEPIPSDSISQDLSNTKLLIMRGGEFLRNDRRIPAAFPIDISYNAEVNANYFIDLETTPNLMVVCDDLSSDDISFFYLRLDGPDIKYIQTHN